MTKKLSPLRVGFDLDGVILYNPFRVIRPVVSLVKKVFLRQKKVHFYVPKSPIERLFWRLFHFTSIVVSPGFNEMVELVRSHQIEAYLITARYSFLKDDLERWLRFIGARQIFKECFYNEKDEQPFIYKKRKIEELDLDVFVEDNWDIVKQIEPALRLWKSSFRLYWVYNILDKRIVYKHRVGYLGEAIERIKGLLAEGHNQADNLEKRPKVAVVTDYYLPHWTGISKSLSYLAEIVGNNYSLEVVTVNHTRDLPAHEVLDGVAITRVPYWFGFSRAKFAPGLLVAAWQAARRSDILFINSPGLMIAPVAIIGRLLGKKVILFHQGDLILPPSFLGWQHLMEWIFDTSLQIACCFASDVSTYTQDYAKHSRVLRHHLSKFRALRIVPVIGEKLAFSHPTFSQLIGAKHPVTIGFAGRFVHEKGFDILLAAIPHVLEKYPHARFVFAGETNLGYERFFEANRNLYEVVAKHVELLGLLDSKKLWQFYQSLDLFVMPSRSECMGQVQLEAALAGVPVVASDIPGGRDFIRQTGYGELFASENPTDLADKICLGLSRLATKPGSQRLSLDYDKVKKYLNPDVTLKQFVALVG